MSTNRDLLKEAIADAKAVKETALANAKAALEEAFTPQIKSMLAAQILAEEEEEDEDDRAEADKAREEREKEMEEGYDEGEELEEEFNLEEILAELELEEGDGDTMEEEMDAPRGNINADMDPNTGFLEEEINLDEMDEDELKALIEDVIEDMIESGELEAGGDPVEFSDEEEEEEGEEEMDMEMDAEEEIEEGIKNVGKAVGKVVKGIFKGSGQKAEEFVDAFVNQDTRPDLKKLYQDAKKFADEKKTNPNVKGENEAYRNLYAEMAQELKDKYGVTGFTDTRPYRDALSILVTGMPAPATISKDPSGLLTTRGMAAREALELEEALKTVKILQQELSEVNLLNSKLLYVNKIFRNKNLTESQKVKVLSAFDKATSVRETKIIYETLNEGLVSKTTTKSSIKESLGMASKPAGVAPKQPIVESDQMVQRFQKLAGIL